MFDFYSAVFIGYVLVALVAIWAMVAPQLSKGLIFRCFVIFALIYYGLVVYFSTTNIMGWPAEKDLPANAKIIAARIIEPSKNHEGGIWFWLNEKPELRRDFFNALRPDKLFIYTGHIQPRAYRLPYDRELHKKLLEKQKQSGRGGKFLMTGKKGVKGKKSKRQGGVDSEDKEIPPFKVVNPVEYFPKDG